MNGLTPVCPYCGKFSVKVGGAAIYPHRPDLYEKTFYQCAPCDAYVGCHPGTTKPLGRLADEKLRRAKNRAHAAFDPLWKEGQMKRGSAYAWLAEQLGIKPDDCHIGMFDIDLCAAVVAACNERRNAKHKAAKAGEE